MCYTLKISKEEQWRRLPWKKFHKQIRKIQERIYNASVRKDLKNVKKLQKILVGLTATKFVAVRRISQDNRGKKAAGLDKIAFLTPSQRLNLVENLSIDGKADQKLNVNKPGFPLTPTQKVKLEKKANTKKTLGISTMKDRAKQCLLLMALEPEWEARFEPNSYGFRPGRSCQDARAAICQTLKQKAKYVFNANINQSLPYIAHGPLLNKLNTIPRFRRQIQAWLKTGFTFEAVDGPNPTKILQGGPIFPFLINVALHGLENHVSQCLSSMSKNGQLPKGSAGLNGLTVRYADRFVLFYPDKKVLENLVAALEMWLSPLGLKLSNGKSTLCHTLNAVDGGASAGFTFLGIYFSHKKCGVGKTAWVANGSVRKPLGYYLSQVPDKSKIQKHTLLIKDMVKKMEHRPQKELITALNQIIFRWTQYYAFTDNAKAFRYCDTRLFWRLMKYACNRHKSKGKKWITKKYFYTFKGRKWVFATPDRSLRLKLYTKAVGRNRYVKITKGKSPYDGDNTYWIKRWKTHISPTKRKLFNLQQGKCDWCKGPLQLEEVVEIHHSTPKKDGGQNIFKNLRLVHGHCHDKIHG